MHISLIVTNNNRVIRLYSSRQPAMRQRFLPPQLRTGTTTKRYDVTVGRRDVNRIIIESEGSKARRIMRPPGLPGVQRKHGNTALETNSIDVRA
jgi:hypothetical protein